MILNGQEISRNDAIKCAYSLRNSNILSALAQEDDFQIARGLLSNPYLPNEILTELVKSSDEEIAAEATKVMNSRDVPLTEVVYSYEDVQRLFGSDYNQDQINDIMDSLNGHEFTPKEALRVFNPEQSITQMDNMRFGRLSGMRVDDLAELSRREYSQEQMQQIAKAVYYGHHLDTINNRVLDPDTPINEVEDIVNNLLNQRNLNLTIGDSEKRNNVFKEALDNEIASLENEKKISDLEKETIGQDDISIFDSIVSGIADREEKAAREEFEANAGESVEKLNEAENNFDYASDKISEVIQQQETEQHILNGSLKVIVTADGNFRYEDVDTAEETQRQEFEKMTLGQKARASSELVKNTDNLSNEELAEKCPYLTALTIDSAKEQIKSNPEAYQRILNNEKVSFTVDKEYAATHSPKEAAIEMLNNVDVHAGGAFRRTGGDLLAKYLKPDKLNRDTIDKSFKPTVRALKEYIQTLATKAKEKLISYTSAGVALNAKMDLINELQQAGRISKDIGDAYRKSLTAAKEYDIINFSKAREAINKSSEALLRAADNIHKAMDRVVETIRPNHEYNKAKNSLNSFIKQLDHTSEKTFKVAKKYFKKNGFSDRQIEKEAVKHKQDIFMRNAEKIKEYRLAAIKAASINLAQQLDKEKVKLNNIEQKLEVKKDAIEANCQDRKLEEKQMHLDTISDINREYDLEKDKVSSAFMKEMKKIDREIEKIGKDGAANKTLIDMYHTRKERLQTEYDSKIKTIENACKDEITIQNKLIENLDKKYDAIAKAEIERAAVPYDDLCNRIDAMTQNLNKFEQYYKNMEALDEKEFAKDAIMDASQIEYNAMMSEEAYDTYMKPYGEVPRDAIVISPSEVSKNSDYIEKMINNYNGDPDIKMFITKNSKDQTEIKIAALDAIRAVDLKVLLQDAGIKFTSTPNKAAEKIERDYSKNEVMQDYDAR